jgi:hypothetical protein
MPQHARYLKQASKLTMWHITRVIQIIACRNRRANHTIVRIIVFEKHYVRHVMRRHVAYGI